MVFNKKAKSLTNIGTYITIIVIMILMLVFVTRIFYEASINPNADMSNSSISYVATINNIDADYYDIKLNSTINESVNEYGLSTDNNESQGIASAFAFAMEFLYFKERITKISNTINAVFTMPSTIAFDLLRLPDEFRVYVNIIWWFLILALALAAIYALRGIVS